MTPEDFLRAAFRIIFAHAYAYVCYFSACISSHDLRGLGPTDRFWFYKASWLIAALAAISLVLFWTSMIRSWAKKQKVDLKWHWLMHGAMAAGLIRFAVLTYLH